MDLETSRMLSGSVRSLLEAGDDPATLGWDEVVADDPRGAWEVWFTEQGRLPAATRALDDVVLGRPAATTAVAHPWPHDLDGADVLPHRVGPTGLVLGPLDDVEQVAVPVRSGDAVALRVVPVDAVAARAADPFDTSLRWHEVTVDADSGELAEVDWPDAVAAARRAVSAEILGCADRMLEIAVEHTTARRQYGQSIASFQAVRHRMAEAHVWITAARRLLAVADDAWSAAAAKAAAGRAAQSVSAQALQVCGAMGMSEEFSLHRYVSRATVLDALYGGHRRLTAELGRTLLASEGSFPRVVEIV